MLKTEFGGDYRAYGDYVHLLLDVWLSMGFKIMVITDSGEIDEAKKKVKLERRQRDVRKLANILHMLEHSDSHDNVLPQERQLPVPTLMMTEFMWRVEQYHSIEKLTLVKVIKGEADPVIGILGRNIPNALVVSTDTDFMFMDGIRYCPFPQFHGYVTSVFTCDKVATALDVPKSRMPFLAVYLGNDYTGVASGTKSIQSKIIEFKEDLGVDADLINNISIPMYRNRDYVGSDPLGFLKKKQIVGTKAKKSTGKASSSSVWRQCWKMDHTPTEELRSKVIHAFEVLDSMSWEANEDFKSVVLKCFHACSPKYSLIAKFSWEGSLQQPYFQGNNQMKFTQALLYQIVFLYVFDRFEGVRVAPSQAFRPEAFFAHLQPYVSLSVEKRLSVTDALVAMAVSRKEQFEKYRVEQGIEPEPVQETALPVDDFREEILKRIGDTRVTLIHGETGSGKSSRIPLYLIQENPYNKVIVCQPRRTAAHSLYEYMRDKVGLRDEVGMRMGGGIKSESATTRLWYVTTGYLQKFAADPKRMEPYTHVIIDEVHERSVDNDMMCYYAKMLLKENPTVRLILMSATLQYSQYQEYFAIQEKALFVGAKRFPRQDLWFDSPEMKAILQSETDKGKIYQQVARDLETEIEKHRYSYSVNLSRKLPKSCESKLLTLVLYLVRAIRKLQRDTGVLIFVSGISEIQDLFSIFESEDPAGNHFDLIAIHSSIPFEEQRQAWTVKNKLLTRVSI